MKNTRFLLNALLIAAVIALIMKWTGAPVLMASRANIEATPELTAYAETIQLVDAKQLDRIISQSSGKGTVLFVYTSWCGYCKKQFPIIEELMNEYGDKIQFIALSMDRDKLALADFLSQRKLPSGFVRYIFSGGLLSELLHSHGITYSGGIPFIALIDTQGKARDAFLGLTGKEKLEIAIGQL